MPTLTQAPSQGDVVKFQIDPNYTNEAITLLLGTNYKSGSVLGKITATGKYKLAVVGAVDGSAVALAVLLNPADATTADATGLILARGPAIVSKAALVFDVSVNLLYVSRGMLLDAEKKRLCALADWHFSGGGSYCQACETQCQDCPARLNQPLTHDGLQVWDLVGRLGGQMRVAGKAVLGWDMSAAMALAHALGLNPMVAAELLPELEAVMVRRTNEMIAASD